MFMQFLLVLGCLKHRYRSALLWINMVFVPEQVVNVEELDWTTATEERLRAFGADTVIAAGFYH